MNLDTAKAVLAKASFFDSRMPKPDLNVARAWAEALGNIDHTDALAVVTAHYQRPEPPRIMPGDIIAAVRTLRAERVRAADSSVLDPHDTDPTDTRGYLNARRARIARIAAGQPVTLERRGEADPDRVKELLEQTAAKLPTMPPALPRNDARNKLRKATS